VDIPTLLMVDEMASNKRQVVTHTQSVRSEVWLSRMDEVRSDRLKNSWAAAQEHGDRFGHDFYQNLFLAQPGVAALFPGDMNAQEQRLTSTLGEAVKLTSNPQQLLLLLRAAGVRHHHYQVEPAHFLVMQDALIKTLSECLGEKKFASVEADWRAFFSHMASVMCHSMAGAGRRF